jgi:hypothetical protein
MIWFYADDSDQQHEVREEELPNLVSAGKVRADTLVWNETMTDWQKCRAVLPDLFSGPGTPPALTAAQRQQVAATYLAPGQPGAPQPTDAVAVCALIFGVLGLMCIQIFSPVAIICGHIALKKANDSGDRSANKGLAIAGLATGYLGLLVLLFILIFYGFAFFAALAGGGFDT